MKIVHFAFQNFSIQQHSHNHKNKHGKRMREKNNFKKRQLAYGQNMWDKVVQNIVTTSPLIIHFILEPCQTSQIHLTDCYIQNGFENLQPLEMLLRHIKMSLLRMEHIIPAKFVGLKPLPIRIKRPSSYLKQDYQYMTCLLMRNSGFCLRRCNLV